MKGPVLGAAWPGQAGFFMAPLLRAAMAALASDRNSIAVGVEDFYRVFRPDADDRRRLRVGKAIVASCVVPCFAIVPLLAHARGGALSMWFLVSAIVVGGLAGLFLGAFFSARANRRGVYLEIGACILFAAWATLTMGDRKILRSRPF